MFASVSDGFLTDSLIIFKTYFIYIIMYPDEAKKILTDTNKYFEILLSLIFQMRFRGYLKVMISFLLH